MEQMDSEVTYNSLRCRELSVDQRTGELRYDSSAERYMFLPVAQFIGAQPISAKCERFSLEIVNPGRSAYITIGLCHKRYPPDRQPGWDDDSIGYHADDGGIYHENGFPGRQFGRVGQGEVMECAFNFDDRTVTFLRNGVQVFTSSPLQIPHGGFYPIVGLHSTGEIARLLETDPWAADTDIVVESKDVVFHSLYRREAKISHASGIVRYHSFSPDLPVGQLLSKWPLSPECDKFSVEVASLGQKSCISIGVCHRCYPSNSQLGWLPNSMAYHVDDGGLYNGSDKTSYKGPKARVGDTLYCEIDFSTMTVIFRRNGGTIFRSTPVTIPPGGFHAAVGFHSPGEAVCLLEKEPWRSELFELTPPIPKYYFSACTESTFDQKTGILSGVPDTFASQLISKHPLTPNCPSFSFEIKSTGASNCHIEIGLCSQHAATNKQLSSDGNSVVYHLSDGRLYVAGKKVLKTQVKPTRGDVVACEFNFTSNTASFTLNKKMVHETPLRTVPKDGVFAAVGLYSQFESVRLCETEPWRDEDIQMQTAATVQDTHDNPIGPKCCICMDKGVTRFLIPCGHTFCDDCIEEWITHHNTCPACRVRYEDVKMLYF